MPARAARFANNGLDVVRLEGNNKGNMMKRVVVLTVLCFVLYGLILLVSGCAFFDQPGETTAEGNRDHFRTLNVNRQEMMGDVDKALLLDRPSRLTDKRIP